MAGSPRSSQALVVLQDAFSQFSSIVSPEDARTFSSTELQDVWSAVREIERQLGERQCLRNMRRIQPFLEGLDRYSKSIGVLCNGTPFLPWIWAPVKLILQLASDYISAFEKIIDAYDRIAKVLPRLDRLSSAFKDNADFQQVLAFVYSDILKFHQQAYTFFRKRGWKCFFNSLWARFDNMRFKNILESLAKHSDLVDREANSINIEKAQDWRTKTAKDTAKRERERQAFQLQTVLSWLNTENSEQEDVFDRLLYGCYPGTCDWIIRNDMLKSWMKRAKDETVIWLTGKPGSGKSVLCGQIVQFLHQEKQTLCLSYFCSYRSTNPQTCSYVLRYLVAQIVRFNPELGYYILDEYIGNGRTPSIQQLRLMIANMLSGFDTVRIVIDGLDEFEDTEQKKILNELIPLATSNSSGVTRKILFSSRDEPHISRTLGQKSLLSLTQEHTTLDIAIRLYVHQTINAIRMSISSSINAKLLEDIEARIVQKSNGMFLWVKLVLATLENAGSVEEIREAVDTLPEGLDKFYGRILSRISKFIPKIKDRAVRILEWIAFSKRPMRRWELQNAISIHVGNPILTNDTKLFDNFLDICKPLIEYGPNETVLFVHFSVQEYLQTDNIGDEIPFLYSAKCHHNIAFSCIAYMSSSFNFIDPTMSIDESMLRIAEGFHGLFLYANDYWPEHLLTYSRDIGGLDANLASNLFAELTRLCNAYEVCKQKLSTSHANNTSESPEDIFDDRLLHLKGHEGIYFMVRDLFSYHQRTRKHLNANITRPCAPEQDTALFSQLTYKYHDIVHQILKADQIPYLSLERLNSFKILYGPSAFACRFQGCPRTNNGFKSQEELEKHEGTHTPRSFCSKPRCEYGNIGFSTKAGLKQHVKNFHRDMPDSQSEDTIRKKSRVPKSRVEISENQYELDLLRGSHEEVTTLNQDQRTMPHLESREDQEIQDVGNFLGNLDLDRLSSEHLTEGDDWYVVYNPQISRALNIDLLHTIAAKSGITGAHFSFDGQYVAISGNKFVGVFDAHSGSLVGKLEDCFPDDGDGNYVRNVCFAPTGNILVLCSDDKIIRICDFSANHFLKVARIIEGHKQVIYDISFAPNGKFIATGSDDKTVRLWTVESGQCFFNASVEDSVTSVAISPDSSQLVAGLLDHSAYLWDINTERLIAQLGGKYGHKDSVYSVTFSPSGKHIVTASLDKTLKKWGSDYEHSQSLPVDFTGHEDCVITSEYTRNGELLLAGSKDRSVQFWDPESGVAVARLSAHKNTVLRIASNPKTDMFVTASGDMRARIWSYSGVQGKGEARLPSNLQPGQCLGEPGVYSEDILAQAGPSVAMAERPKPQAPQRVGPSSYWSVTEQTDFRRYIAHFGTDFTAIANHMRTKTQTMVKNQYQRLVENTPELLQAAQEADARRNAREDLGEPPTPTPTKKRYDSDLFGSEWSGFEARSTPSTKYSN